MNTSHPTSKQQLIQLLKSNLQKLQVFHEQTQNQLQQMQTRYQSQKIKRKQLNQQLSQKQHKIQQLIENQTKTLCDKVNQGLYNTLQTANKMRLEADTSTRTLSQQNTILNENIINKDKELIEHRISSKLATKKISALSQKKVDGQRKQSLLQDTKQQLIKNVQIIKQQFNKIQKQQKQLRMHIDNMKKLKIFLNKHFQPNFKVAPLEKINQKNNVGDTDNFWAHV